jgi:hypothetical protein
MKSSKHAVDFLNGRGPRFFADPGADAGLACPFEC